MIEWLAPLVTGVAVAPCAWLALRRPRPRRSPGRVSARDLGLERLGPTWTLVQFSCYACQPCRVSLNRLAEAAAHCGEALVVELPLQRSGRLARELRVQTAPTVLLLDAQGDVLRRWSTPPERADLARALGPGAPRYTAAAGSTSKLRA